MPSDITGANLQKLYAPPPGVDPRTLNQTLFAPNFLNPYSESYTFGIQRMVGSHMGLEMRYVGTQAVHQFATRNGNPYIAGFANNGFANVLPPGVTPGVNTTCSTCNGLQLAYTIRDLANQLTMSTAFTWSKTMDNISEVYTFTSSGSIVLAQDPFNTHSGERAL